METYSIKGSKDSEVTFCPQRGGIITSLKLNNNEILYFDEETFNTRNGSVRGGIPILFPNAGELKENTLYSKLKRHGFARDLGWSFNKTENSFNESLVSNDQSKESYNFDFQLNISGDFDNNFFVLKQSIKNTGEVGLPVATGLHPYFKIPNEEKKNIKFNFEGGDDASEQFGVWANGGTVYIDNPKKYDPDNVISIDVPLLGTIIMDVSSEYQKIWIWSEPGKDFICVEPMMRCLNGLVDDPKIIEPGNTLEAYIKISLT